MWYTEAEAATTSASTSRWRAYLEDLLEGPLNPIISTVMFERVPRQMRGRVMGALTSGAYVAMPLGMLLAGFISKRFGVITAVVFVAAGYLLITLTTFLNPAMREMDRPRTAPAVV